MDRTEQFRSAAAAANRGRRRHGWRYTPELKALALEHCRESHASGHSYAEIAEALGNLDADAELLAQGADGEPPGALRLVPPGRVGRSDGGADAPDHQDSLTEDVSNLALEQPEIFLRKDSRSPNLVVDTKPFKQAEQAFLLCSISSCSLRARCRTCSNRAPQEALGWNQ